MESILRDDEPNEEKGQVYSASSVEIDEINETPCSYSSKNDEAAHNVGYNNTLNRLSELSNELEQVNANFPNSSHELKQWHEKISFLEQSIWQIKSYLREKQQQCSRIFKSDALHSAIIPL